MNIETVRDFLLWCTIINYGLLLCWFLVFTLAHGWIQRLHGRWFQIPPERFDTIHYTVMAAYKVGVLLFNLVPYVALLIIGG